MERGTRMEITYNATRSASALWRQALRNVRCILPDDAADVEAEVERLRKELQDDWRKWPVGSTSETQPE